MSSWYIRKNEQQTGPFTHEQITEMARAGQLGRADPVWQEGTPAWVAASTVPGLFPTPPSPLPIYWKRIKFHAKRAAEWNLRAVEVTAAEEAELIGLSVDDPGARAYLAWRRSVLYLVVFAAAVTAVTGIIGSLAAEHAGLNGFGKFIEFLRAAALLVMPITAWKAAKVWSRHKASRRMVLIGWTISFLAPLLLELIPAAVRYDVEGLTARGMANEQSVRLIGAIADYITLMPTVLALVPGVLRACIRVKVLLPQSMLPGWFLVAMSPLWLFLFLVVFATINQIASDFLLVIGVVAIAAAPMLYVKNAALFTRPVAPEDLEKLHKVQFYVRLILGAGVGFVLLWFCTGRMLGVPIVAFEGQALVRPWSPDLIKFPLEFGSHSLFTMTLVADLMMAMNLAVWNQTKAFMGTPAAAEYDKTMSEIEEAGGRE